jgi:3-hydroxyacyl-[acyl-carrier-protein] dehydratase
MNHAAGYLLLRKLGGEKFVFLGGVKRAKFRRFVLPGDKMVVDARITYEGSGFAIAETSVRVKDQVAADAEVVMISAAFPTAELAEEMRSRIALIPVNKAVNDAANA